MTSNMVVAMCDVMQMWVSIQIEGTAVAESVALFTHHQAAQLSEFCQPDRGTHTRIKNCKLFDPNESKSLFYSAHTHVCVST